MKKLNWGMIWAILFCFVFWMFIVFSAHNCSISTGCQTAIINQGDANENDRKMPDLQKKQAIDKASLDAKADFR